MSFTSSALASQKYSRTQAAHDPPNERARSRPAFREMSELLFSDDDGQALKCTLLTAHCKNSTIDLARGHLPGRSTKGAKVHRRALCLNPHLDGLCYAVVSTDAHAAPVLHCLLHCLCSSKPQVPGETSAHPATAPEAGLVASSGREPAKHGPRGRLKAAPRGSSAAGREGTARSVVHCKKMHAHEQPLFREPVSVPMVHVRGWCVAVLLPE